jgi:serine/threonine protein kinase
MSARHHPIGRAKHTDEQRGIDLVVSSLPHDYEVYSNVDLATGRRGGHTYEHDLLILAPHAVFTVELKSWGGRITGNRDRWQLEDGAIVQSPIPLVTDKARTLKGSLLTRNRALRDVWVQGLVVVSGADAQVFISADYDHFVATKSNVARALTDPAVWGLSGQALDKSQRSSVLHIFADGVPVTVPTRIGQYELLQRLPSEGRPFDAWLGKAPFGERRVLHVYEIRGDNEKARKRSRDHALREATLHAQLKGGPDLLDYCDYDTIDHPQRIVLRFEDTTPLLPASTWLAVHKPGLEDRLRVAKRVASALAWVHQKDVVHRRLSVQAVLVSPDPTPADVRLSALELARDLTGRAPTVSASALEDPSYRCMAPELLRTGEATKASDLFSLGATIFELINGRALFERAEDSLRVLDLPPLHVGEKPAPQKVTELVRALLAPQPGDRPVSAADVARQLEEVLADASRPATQTHRGVLKPGDCINDVYELVDLLGEGATGSSWKVQHRLDGSLLVAKIADAAQAEVVKNEADVLLRVQHPNLVRYRELIPYEGGNVLLLQLAAGVDGRTWAGAGDPLDPAQLQGLAAGLFGALGALHDAGWLHRDVKPENLILSEPGARPTLIDLGLARREGSEGELTVGSVPYKDALLWDTGVWTAANDLFAAWLVIYEILTGVHPFDDRPESGKRPSIDTSTFPDTFPRAATDRLGALFDAALSPDPTARPASAAAAVECMRAVFAPPAATGIDPATLRQPKIQSLPLPLPMFQAVQAPAAPSASLSPALPADLVLASDVTALQLTARAESTLERLGINTVGDLAAVDPAALSALHNVGRKTRAELLALTQAVRARFPGIVTAPVQASAPTPFYAPLVDSDRPLTELGAVLTESVRIALNDRGIDTIGGLAALSPAVLGKLPRVGPGKIKLLHKALAALGGDTDRPGSLAELGTALKKELGADFAILTVHAGLVDGVPHSSIDTAELLKLTRQRVSQAVDVEALRAGASAAAWLLGTVEDVLPRAGFAPIEDVARALPARLAASDDASALGYARLAAVLLQPRQRLTQIEGVQLAARPPWTPETITALRDVLIAKANWPPLPLAEARTLVWDAIPPELQGALRRWGADAGALLQAVIACCPDIRRTPDEALFTPPVDFADALKAYRPRLQTGRGPDALLEALRQEYHFVSEPSDLRQALAARSLALRGGLIVEAIEEPERAPIVAVVDPVIPRQRVGSKGAIDVRGLVAAVEQGGFRIAALPLERHHILCEQLAGALGDALTPDRVRFIDVDRALLETLQDRDLWDDAIVEDSRPGARWGWATSDLEAGLEAAVLGTDAKGPAARPGVITVLGRPALLGPLELMNWLSGFYERARGGRYGLIVLALPGGVHDGRVRLNEEYGLAYTPDMAAMCLLAEGDVAA